jgi:RHS repeat-associated protein
VTAVGTWTASTSVGGYLGTNYQVHAAGTGANTFTWNVPVATAGTYQVYARWTAYPNRATNAPFTIATSAGPQSVVVNQQDSASGSWNLLGTWSFNAGTAAVTLTDAANGYVIADAVMLVPPGAAPNTASWSASLPNAGPWRVYARWAQYPNRATNATYVVQADGGPVPVVVNQQAGGGAWVMLGEYVFTNGTGRVDITDQANGYVVADAVKFEPPGAALEAATWTPQLTQPARFDVYARWTQNANRSSTATYTVTHQAGGTSIVENQQAGGGVWNLLGTFTFAPGQGVRLEASDGGYVTADAVRFTPSADQPSTGGVYYVHADQLGTPRMITRPSDNAIVWRWDNTEPFGDSQANEDPSGLGAFAYNLRFPGQYRDAETSTNYNYFRDYDPAIGRYVESDPIGLYGVRTHTLMLVRMRSASLIPSDWQRGAFLRPTSHYQGWSARQESVRWAPLGSFSP